MQFTCMLFIFSLYLELSQYLPIEFHVFGDNGHSRLVGVAPLSISRVCHGYGEIGHWSKEYL